MGTPDRESESQWTEEGTHPPVSGRVGRTIAGRYELVEPLGAGGMAIIHRAIDLRTGRWVAIKRPRTRAVEATDPRIAPGVSLARERKALLILDHPSVVRLHGAGVDEEGAPFLVLSLVEGARSIVVFARSAPYPLRIRAVSEMFEAIGHVHRRGLLHRDLKPSNVLVCTGAAGGRRVGSVSLIDFGLAAGVDDEQHPDAAHAGPFPLVGSALYLAPELVEGRAASAATEIYAAGLIAAEVLTGVHPLRGGRSSATLAALRDVPRRWAHLQRDAPTRMLLERLLARRPEDRWGSAEEVVAWLRVVGSGRGRLR